MKIGHLFIIIHILQLKILNCDDNNTENVIKTTTRNSKKLWSILTLVHFFNNGCVVSNSIRKGTCYTRKQCSHKGGIITGKCANGFGVCCLFLVSCGEQTQENCTYFRSPGYPNTFVLPTSMSAMCDLRVLTINSQICQIRLDFINFELFGVQEGECQVDLFTVQNSDVSTSGSIPQLCGINSGQHIYINVPRGSNSIQLRAIFQYLFDNPQLGRRFEIKITQIECTNELTAPSGCLQYFTGQSGTITSFNYAGSTPLSEGYPINQNYGICIRKEVGFCSIRYSANGPFQFGISESDDGAQNGTNCMINASDGGSRDDYLLIPGGSGISNTSGTADRYCGGAFSPITTSLMPYVINVISGDKYDGEAGFRLQYRQIPCTNSSRN